mmetsp:Transcript_20577/g.43098  ORF Transcript_20577/g.43098 Transcript_20577/m.43098 type:complete len:127 (-) Transcript_20577:131-511(-)
MCWFYTPICTLEAPSSSDTCYKWWTFVEITELLTNSDFQQQINLLHNLYNNRKNITDAHPRYNELFSRTDAEVLGWLLDSIKSVVRSETICIAKGLHFTVAAGSSMRLFRDTTLSARRASKTSRNW